VQDLFVGVPAVIGRNGIERIIEVDLTAQEKNGLALSAEAVQKTCREVDTLLRT
jgi:malate dehydrogenase